MQEYSLSGFGDDSVILDPGTILGWDSWFYGLQVCGF